MRIWQLPFRERSHLAAEREVQISPFSWQQIVSGDALSEISGTNDEREKQHEATNQGVPVYV